MLLQRDACLLAERADEGKTKNLVISVETTPVIVRSAKHTGLVRLGDVFAVRMLCSSIDLVVCDILVPHGVQDIADNHGLYVIEQNIEPHRNESDREAVTNKENCLVFQGVTNGDGGDGKPSVGEDHGPPTQMEVNCP